MSDPDGFPTPAWFRAEPGDCCGHTVVSRLGYCQRCGSYRSGYDQEASFGAVERARPLGLVAIESEWDVR